MVAWAAEGCFWLGTLILLGVAAIDRAQAVRQAQARRQADVRSLPVARRRGWRQAGPPVEAESAASEPAPAPKT